MANTDEILETFGWNINELMRYFPPFNSFMNNPRVLRANFFVALCFMLLGIFLAFICLSRVTQQKN